MIRFTWSRFRIQALAGAGVLAIAGAVLLVTGIRLAHPPACRRRRRGGVGRRGLPVDRDRDLPRPGPALALAGFSFWWMT